MDEPETSVQAGPQETITTIIPTNTAGDGMSLPQTVLNAAGLGWAIAELLGRCFLLQEVQPAGLDWTGDKLVKLQEIYTPREKIRALVVYMRFLADALDVSSSVIEYENDPDNGRAYMDVLEADVKLLTQHNLDPALGVTREQLRGKINERLFFWDLRIHDTLQDRPTEVHKAYLVGRTLASLRWYLGLQGMMQDNVFMEKVCNEYVPLLQPYVSPFTTGALANSIDPWWKAISGGQVQTDPDGVAPKELQKQADIWFSLVTNERNALSYAPPSTGSRSYIWKVLQVSWPLFLVGGLVIILILALLLFVIISNLNPITKEVTAVVALLTALGITHTVVNATGSILQKAVSEVTGTIRGSVIDNIRHSTQQQEVNTATYIPPAGADLKVAQKAR
jgi:hypothetical protein